MQRSESANYCFQNLLYGENLWTYPKLNSYNEGDFYFSGLANDQSWGILLTSNNKSPKFHIAFRHRTILPIQRFQFEGVFTEGSSLKRWSYSPRKRMLESFKSPPERISIRNSDFWSFYWGSYVEEDLYFGKLIQLKFLNKVRNQWK